MTLYSFNLKITKEDGGYSIQCKELPGAISQGKTIDEAMKNIKQYQATSKRFLKNLSR